MVAPTEAADAPGYYMPQAEPVLLAKTAAAIAKGDVLEYVAASDNFRTAATSSVSSRYAVATKPALAADATVEAVASGPVTVTADGAIGKYAMVKVSTATAGQVVEAAPATDAFGTVVGVYVGKVGANERNGVAFANAADGDVIIIDLNRRTT